MPRSLWLRLRLVGRCSEKGEMLMYVARHGMAVPGVGIPDSSSMYSGTRPCQRTYNMMRKK